MVVLLAWFSTATHLCALTFLRNHFYTHPRQRTVRLFLMVVILLLLIVALVPLSDFESTPGLYSPEGDEWWSEKAAFDGEHAICYFRELNQWRRYDGMVTHLFLLVYGSFSRALKFFPTRSWGNKVRARLAHALQWPIRKARARASVDKLAAVPMVHVPLLAAYVTARLYLDYFISVAAEVSTRTHLRGSVLYPMLTLIQVFYLYFVVAWGSHKVISLRIERGPKGENTWTFGQVVPVVSILGPVFALSDTFLLAFRTTDSFHETQVTRSMQRGRKNEHMFTAAWTRMKEGKIRPIHLRTFL